MSHVHDLDNLEIEVTWRDEDDFRIDESEPLGGEWIINIDVGTSCCLEVPLAFIMELAGKAVASPQYRAVYKPNECGVEGAICCWEDPPEGMGK